MSIPAVLDPVPCSAYMNQLYGPRDQGIPDGEWAFCPAEPSHLTRQPDCVEPVANDVKNFAQSPKELEAGHVKSMGIVVKVN